MGRRKRKSTRKSKLCSVCENSYQASISSTFPCSEHHGSVPHKICDTCLYSHILTVLSIDITNSVICPMQKCDAKIPKDVIQLILVKSNPTLSTEYALKGGWRGTSAEWIRRFAALCPHCSVPIEKNGGCNQVQCRQCRRGFNWELAKNSKLYRMRTRYNTIIPSIRGIFWRVLIATSILFLLGWCLIYREKTASIIDRSSTFVNYLSNLSPMALFK